MRKKFLTLVITFAAVFFAAHGNSFSNDSSGFPNVSPTFEKGDFVINLGIGIGGVPRGTTGLPPVTISGEYGLIEDLFTENLNLGIGAIVGLQTYSYWGENYVSLSFAARAAAHYPLVENFDVHAGVVTGFRTNPGNVILGSYVGGRYYFSPNIGVMAEVGYGITYINAGVAFKL